MGLEAPFVFRRTSVLFFKTKPPAYLETREVGRRRPVSRERDKKTLSPTTASIAAKVKIIKGPKLEVLVKRKKRAKSIMSKRSTILIRLFAWVKKEIREEKKSRLIKALKEDMGLPFF